MPLNAFIYIENEEEDDDGNAAFYEVILQWVPRIGDTLQLTSNVDQRDGRPHLHDLEVTRVVHRVHDIDRQNVDTKHGFHFLEITGRRTFEP